MSEKVEKDEYELIFDVCIFFNSEVVPVRLTLDGANIVIC